MYLKSKNQKYEDLSESQLKEEAKNFLKDKYPGSKQPPNQMVQLMSSPSADKSLAASAIVNPEDNQPCDASGSLMSYINVFVC